MVSGQLGGWPLSHTGPSLRADGAMGSPSDLGQVPSSPAKGGFGRGLEIIQEPSRVSDTFIIVCFEKPPSNRLDNALPK